LKGNFGASKRHLQGGRCTCFLAVHRAKKEHESALVLRNFGNDFYDGFCTCRNKRKNPTLRLWVLKDSFCNDIAERCATTIRGSLREGAGAVGD
jgi:hypothetical protein